LFDLLFGNFYRFMRRHLGSGRPMGDQPRALAAMSGLYEFNFALSSVFINIFLFRDKDDWWVVGVYNLTQYVAIVPAFFAGGYLARRFGHVLSFRLGFLFNALVFFMALLLREESVHHPHLLGTLAGLGIGFYYLGLHSLTLDLTRSSERDHFLSYQLYLASLSRILAPALAGWTITSFKPHEASETSLLGYYLVFAVAMTLYSA
jgi:MFS transporter, YQGE family, putative transporter